MKIEHIAMYVNDIEKAKGFFVTYFDAKSNDGYHNTVTGFKSYFLSFSDGARLEIMNRPDMCDIEKTLPGQVLFTLHFLLEVRKMLII